MKSHSRRKKAPTKSIAGNESVPDQKMRVADPDSAVFQARYSKLLLFRNLLITLAASSVAISVDGLTRGKDSYVNRFFKDDDGAMVKISSAVMMLVMMNIMYKIANLDLRKSAAKGLKTDEKNAEVERGKMLEYQKQQKAKEAEAAKKRKAEEWAKSIQEDEKRIAEKERRLRRQRIAQIKAAVKASQESRRGVSDIVESKRKGSDVAGYFPTVSSAMYSLGSGIASTGYNLASKLMNIQLM